MNGVCRWVVVAVSGHQAEYLSLGLGGGWRLLPNLLTEHTNIASVGMTGGSLVVAGGFSG